MKTGQEAGLSRGTTRSRLRKRYKAPASKEWQPPSRTRLLVRDVLLNETNHSHPTHTLVHSSSAVGSSV